MQKLKYKKKDKTPILKIKRKQNYNLDQTLLFIQTDFNAGSYTKDLFLSVYVTTVS